MNILVNNFCSAVRQGYGNACKASRISSASLRVVLAESAQSMSLLQNFIKFTCNS